MQRSRQGSTSCRPTAHLVSIVLKLRSATTCTEDDRRRALDIAFGNLPEERVLFWSITGSRCVQCHAARHQSPHRIQRKAVGAARGSVRGLPGPGARISPGLKYHASGRCQTLPGRAHNLLEPSRSRPISPYGEGISVRLTRRPQPLAVAHHRLDEVCQVPRTKIARTFVGPECSTRCVSNNINNNINTRHALRGGTHIPRAVSGVYGWSRWLIRLSTTNSKL